MSERLTQVETARRLGIGARRVRALSTEEVLSRHLDGSYPWPLVQAEYRAYRDEIVARRSAAYGDAEYLEARRRKTVAQARLAELDARDAERGFVATDDVQELVGASLERLSRTLREVPVRHAPALAERAGIEEADALELLRGVVEEVLEAAK